ncbi:MAG: 3-deoxy-D-manno-octulosonic acid transferase, partial [Muribaculaceae bacterium]|nr:3-deoxy-D-manno-octulosonic acid transferase [Muribaculaceae bacterium]
MNPLYSAGIAIYGGAARLVSLGSPKVRHMLSGQKETIDRLRNFREHMAPDGFDVWFHAASLGEFEQARPLIDSLLAKDSSKRILLSFFSPSGYEVRCDYNPRVAVVYLPFDTPGNVDAFLDAARPRMAIFVKYEFWGNYLEKLKKRGIPTYIISAIFRPSQRFFKPWGGVFRKMLGNFEHLYVQDERSRRLLAGVGVDNVTVAGDTRFDRVTAIRENRKAIPEIECFLASGAKDGFKMVFGSSWDRDEVVYVPWLKAHPAVKAIIAPHEFDKNRLAEMRRCLDGSRTMLFSDFKEIYHRTREEAAKVGAKISYLIIYCFGLLCSLYEYA